jgi:putative ABC transport system permease protein
MERPQFDILISMGYLGRRAYESWGSRLVAVLARLRPGITLQQAQANIDSIVARVVEEAPAEDPGYGSTLVSLPGLIRRAYGTGLYFLWAAAGFVLLLVCVNVANLMLARAVSRQRELGVRRALGAGRGRLLSLLLAESTILGMLGGALGLLVALWGSGALVSLLPSFIYRLDSVELDGRVLAFSFLASLATAVLVGLLPAVRSCRPDLQETLKEGARGTPGGRLRWLRALVVAQVAIALLLLTGAGLMLSSFRNLTAVDTGFDRENLILAEVEKLPGPLSRYEGGEAVMLMNRIIERVEAFPGVLAAAGIDYPPLAGLHVFVDFTLADGPAVPEEERETAIRFVVSPGYFETMETRVAIGRPLTEADQEERLRFTYPDEETVERLEEMTDAERIDLQRQQVIPVLVNETMASRYWPDESPLGEGFYVGNVDPEDPTGPLLTVVGVVPEVRTKRMDEAPWPQFYMPADTFSRWLVIRTSSDPETMVGALRTEIRAVDPAEVRMTRAQTMHDLFRASTAESRSLTMLVVGFAVLSTALAAIGLFGVMAYSVACRTHEIGVRMSLGARPREIFRLVLGQGMILAAAGVGIGLLGSIVLTRYIASLLFGVSPLDWGTLLGVSLLLTLVALLACYLPTRHASRVDPLTALRSD